MLPVVLLVGAVLVDLAVTHRVPGWLAGPLVAGLVYGAAVRPRTALGLLPPWNWWSVIPVAVGFGVLWAAVDLLARQRLVRSLAGAGRTRTPRRVVSPDERGMERVR